MSKSYPTDLTDEQWELLSSLIPEENQGCRPRCVDLRAVMNAMFYILYAGCAWRMLLHDFLKWQTVYYYFRKWRMDGTWERISRKLQQWVRVVEDREPNPSAAIVDCQSVENGTMVSQAVGFDLGKLVKGRKRHLLFDTLGLVLMVVVTSAYESDSSGAKKLFASARQIISDRLGFCIFD
ncbi:IS5 family transposase [Calothrix membranacea FACHB-236]|nr:IS5 family transposase [Calothrix membranacea FACHB-236]